MDWLVAIGLAFFFAAVMAAAWGVMTDRATAIALQPELVRIRAVSKAIAAIGRPTQPYMTHFVRENGDLIWTNVGWQPGHAPGEVITLHGKPYEIIEVHDPAFGTDELEATLVLRAA